MVAGLAVALDPPGLVSLAADEPAAAALTAGLAVVGLLLASCSPTSPPAPRPGGAPRATCKTRSLAERCRVPPRPHRPAVVPQRTAFQAAAVVAPRRYLAGVGLAALLVQRSTCDCRASCCDGYTEFCCSLTGHGRTTARRARSSSGWWKADGSGLCGGAPRYYMDCNVVPPANPCSCGCASGNCGLRKACCTASGTASAAGDLARWGRSCAESSPARPRGSSIRPAPAGAHDNNTRFHDAPCLRTGGLEAWCLLRDTNTKGPSTAQSGSA